MEPIRINNKVKQAASNSWAKHPTDSAKAIGEANLRKGDSDIFGREPDNRRGKKKKPISEVSVGDVLEIDAYSATRPSGRSSSSVWLGEIGDEPKSKKYDYAEFGGGEKERTWFHIGGKLTVKVVSAVRNKRDRKMDCVGKIVSHHRESYQRSIDRDNKEYISAIARIVGTEVKFKI